ncbi:MAG: response regulator transcription factor, partial [Acidobacteriota bacterium]
MIRVFLVEDQTLVREGIRSLLALDGAMTIVGEAADGDEAIAAIPSSGADVVLLDMRLPRRSGIEVLQHLSREGS